MTEQANCRPKIALVVDIDGWAFFNIAQQLKTHLADRFEVEIFSVEAVGGVHRVLLLTRGFDLVHFFWRMHLVELQSAQTADRLQHLGLDAASVLAEYRRATAITSSVYDHLFLDGAEIRTELAQAMGLLSGYSVSSRRLWHIYANAGDYPMPSAVLQDGVDLTLFAPHNLERFEAVGDRPLVVGWAGNSAWSADMEDFKGVHTLLRPVIDRLRDQGCSIRLKLADRQVALVPQTEMPAFYAGIDLYVCTSKIEGTPNPVLEAMACGVPVVSTDVGIVPEVFGPAQRAMLLSERSAEALEAALRQVLDDRALLKRLSDENLKSIAGWDWKVKAASFGDFFDVTLAGCAERRRHVPTARTGGELSWNNVSPQRRMRVAHAPHTAQWLRENIVVCMLFYNKLEQTIESVESFLTAGVRVNILDNGSEASAAQRMRDNFAANSLVQIVDAGRNAGVSGGRNIQLRTTTAPWLFFADNDISIQTHDWLQQLAEAMDANPHADIFVPRLFNKHEDGWGSMSDFVADHQGNCAFVATNAPFSNAFPGGASVIARSVFERLGPYDEDLFVGFEDFELAIRAWRHDRPLFVQHVEGIVLVHDHRISRAEADKQSARVRYDNGHISHSHAVVHRKHGVLLDPNFGDWLNEQVRQLTGEAQAQANEPSHKFAHALHGATVRPRYSGQGVRLLVLVDGSGAQAWFSLRSAAQAAERARLCGIDVSLCMLGASETLIRGAMDGGLLSATEANHSLAAAFPCQPIDAVCCLTTGMMSADFLLQLAQRLTVDACDEPRVYVPERVVWVARSGAGAQLRRVGAVDLVGIADSEQLVPLFAVPAGLIDLLGDGCALSFVDTASRWLTRLAAQGYSGRGVDESAVVIAIAEDRASGIKAMVGQLNAGGALKVEHSTWLELEQENLRSIALHQDIAAPSWFAVPAGIQHQEALVSPSVYPVLEGLLDARLDHVMIVPWLRRGGADRAALAYLRALQMEMPGRVLLITTEPVASEWGTRVPEGVRCLDWSTLADWGSNDNARRALAWLLVRLRPTSIHVMNAWLGWELLAASGAQLRAVSKVFASLFWYGPSDARRLAGYASDYVPRLEAGGAVDLYLTDNAAFPRQLQKDYGLAPSRFHCVWHPTAQIVEAADRPPIGDKPTVLWASRFAPEKRLDLLLKIAQECPSICFAVYGEVDAGDAKLTGIRDELRALANVKLGGAFDDFTRLPLNDCDLFLYTSSSDGMPNVVIEAMAHGLPVIAAVVGGIGDLVDEVTGWPVRDVHDSTAYSAMLRSALSSGEERWARATRGLARVRERHSFDAFVDQLRQVPGYLAAR